MNCLLLLGSPRKNGNTETLAGRVAGVVEKNGGHVESVRLCELDIAPCIDCGECRKNGRCVIDDDMQELYSKIDKANTIIIASPIYFYGVTAQTKVFIDRTQALWSRKYLLKQRIETTGGLERKGYFLSVAATSGEKCFDGAILTARYCFDAMDVAWGGELVIPGIDHMGALAKNPSALAKAAGFAESILYFGRHN